MMSSTYLSILNFLGSLVADLIEREPDNALELTFRILVNCELLSCSSHTIPRHLRIATS